MTKITGFLVSALLVVLSFWLNICYNHDVLNGGIRVIETEPTARADEESQTSRHENISLTEAGREINRESAPSSEEVPTGEVEPQPTEIEPSDSTPQAPDSESKPEPIVASRESSASLVSAKLTREEENFVDETVSPNGGKLVSIPSFDVDALHGENNDDDRIIGLTKEDMKNATKKRNTRL